VMSMNDKGPPGESFHDLEASKPIIKQGTFAYGDLVRCGIEIYQTDICPGTGDYEDPEERREDKFGTFYNVRYLWAHDNGRSFSGAMGFASVESAMRYVESVACDVRWS